MRAQIIADASAISLTTAIQQMIEPGSCIRTDGWTGYLSLDKYGYTHQVVSKEAIIGENTLPIVNRVVALIQRWLLGTYQGAVRASHLDYYLDEYTFRFNRRKSKSRGKLFYRLVQQAVSICPVENKWIRGGKHDRSKAVKNQT